MSDKDSRTQKGRKIVAVLEDFRYPMKGLSILDLGAGAGIVAGELTRHGNRVVGLDVSSRHFENSPAQLLLGDAHELPFKEESFDIVVCNHILEHVENPARVLSETRRVLRKGGFVYLSQGNRLWPIEPHHRLPFLSYLPKRAANLYLKLLHRGATYDGVRLLTLLELEALLHERFEAVVDVTETVLLDPGRYQASDVVPSRIHRILKHLPRRSVSYLRMFLPGWIYVLKK